MNKEILPKNYSFIDNKVYINISELTIKDIENLLDIGLIKECKCVKDFRRDWVNYYISIDTLLDTIDELVDELNYKNSQIRDYEQMLLNDYDAEMEIPRIGEV